MGLALVPIGNGSHIESEVVVMAMLDTKAKGFLEIYRVRDVEAINVSPTQPADVVVDSPISVEGVREECFWAPRRIEVVFSTCSVKRRRPLLPINEEHVIPFAIPHGAGRMNVIVDSYVMTFSFNIGY